jgi:hypothetical protein
MDTNDKHTPGPWSVITPPSFTLDTRHVHSAAGETVATVTGCGVFADVANARLIAAAPDMLAALRDLVAQVAAYESIHGANTSPICPDAARAAIAKATA